MRFTAPAGRAFTSRFSGTDRGLDSNVDGNGLSDGKGIPGVSMTLVRADGTTLAATTRTDVDGFYKFCGLVPGTYTVKVNVTTLPKDATNTYDLDGERTSETKAVLATTDNLDVDFGYIFPVVKNTVITAAPATVSPAPPAGTLSYTGSETTQRGLMGLSMLLIGFGLVGLARNRRRLGAN